MTPPISPSDLQRVLKTLPPERPDQFPHLADLTPDALLRRKVRIAQIAKRLEQELHAIDAELLSDLAMLNLDLVFVPLVDGFSSSDHEPVVNMTQKFGMSLRVFRVRHSGMEGHNRC